ncbi:MAG: PIN domain-containing protein [Proteobacteria bacterium]|nr:PIN domain-containing protein [Pseudomonadota bacterium]
MLSLTLFANPLPLELNLEAAEIYLRGRQRGLTIRSSTDCLIAAIAIQFDLIVWHRDRDFDHIGKYTGLRVVKNII